MKETRAGRYGRNLAIWIDYTIDTMPENLRDDYRAIFLQELNTYSLKPRKNGQLRNEGRVNELSDLVKEDINNPEKLQD